MAIPNIIDHTDQIINVFPRRIISISEKNIQKEPFSLEINPNSRIPALTDTFTGGVTIRLFESGWVMQYLIEQYDKDHLVSHPQASRESYEVTNRLFFLNAGVESMHGQTNYFFRCAAEKIEYGINQYQNETWRLYCLLNEYISKSTSGYLIGSKYTIADVAHLGWVTAADMATTSPSQKNGRKECWLDQG